jgi:hypothetical protein
MEVLIKKSPLAPLFQRGVHTSLWKREVGRDFITNPYSTL